MKKLFKVLIVLVFSFLVVNAHEDSKHNFSKIASKKPILVQEKGKEYCKICGMKLKDHYKNSHFAITKDDKKAQYCSLRCVLADKNQVNLNLLQTIDAKTEQQISANNAFYVVGSKAPSTMSKISFYAFKNEDDAKEFMTKFGGEIKNFNQAVAIMEENFASDDEMRNAKKMKKIYPMGEKIYASQCDKIDISQFDNINELKENIGSFCKNLDDMQAHAVTLYLWEFANKKDETLEISENDKCPVCGMFVHKFSKWATKIYDKNGKYFAFDGVKDMMKFIINEKFESTKILVRDYYTQKVIDGKSAFYVIGSDVLGPMGNELIPFSKKTDASKFMMEHKGKEILNFDEINKKVVCSLDGETC